MWNCAGTIRAALEGAPLREVDELTLVRALSAAFQNGCEPLRAGAGQVAAERPPRAALKALVSSSCEAGHCPTGTPGRFPSHTRLLRRHLWAAGAPVLPAVLAESAGKDSQRTLPVGAARGLSRPFRWARPLQTP